MKRLILLLLLATFSFTGCEKDSSQQVIQPEELSLSAQIKVSSKENGQYLLDQEYKSILMSANSLPCNPPGDIKIQAIGTKACGGPTAFVPYVVYKDGSSQLKRLEEFTNAQDIFNKRWGISSDCAIIVAPKGVACVNDKIQLVY